MRGLLDTSVFVALEHDRTIDFDLLPDESAISVITLAELEIGVLMAPSDEARARRLATLSAAQRRHQPLPIDTAVASEFSRITAELAAAGKRLQPHDRWIAATALAHGVGLWTQDRGFEKVSGLRLQLV